MSLSKEIRQIAIENKPCRGVHAGLAMAFIPVAAHGYLLYLFVDPEDHGDFENNWYRTYLLFVAEALK